MREPDSRRERAGGKVDHRLGIWLEGQGEAVCGVREGGGDRGSALSSPREGRTREEKIKPFQKLGVRQESALMQVETAAAVARKEHGPPQR